MEIMRWDRQLKFFILTPSVRWIIGAAAKEHFRLVTEPTQVPPSAHAACAGPPGDFNGNVRNFGNGAPQVSVGLHISVGSSSRFDPRHRRRCRR